MPSNKRVPLGQPGDIFDQIAGDNQRQAQPKSVPLGQPGDIFDQIAPDKPQPQVGPTPPGLQGNISAAPAPSMWDRFRMAVANSAVGHALEQGMPKVADALNLHPTETVNSPTYQQHSQQLISPDYLMQNSPQTAVGRMAKGALRSAGALTSGGNLATMAATAATGGLLAPAAAAGGALGVAGKIGQNAIKYGMGALGGAGLYQSGKKAVRQFSNGDTAGAEESLGEMLPNAAMMLPAAAKPIEATGDQLQATGANVMNGFLKATKKAYRYDHNPGLGVLQEGPKTSIALTRDSFYNKVNNAANRAGEGLPPLVEQQTGTVPSSDLKAIVDTPFNQRKSVLAGPGGNPTAIPTFDAVQETFSPYTQRRGNVSAQELYGIKRNLDDMINWGRDVDPTEATLNNTRREIRSNIAQKLYEIAPELEQPSRRYGDLATAAKLASDRRFDTNGSLFDPIKLGASLAGGGSVSTSHDPALGALTGIGVRALPEIAKAPIVRTGTATGLFQLGRGLSAAGARLSRSTPVISNTGNLDWFWKKPKGH
jgi:hypothetical protein